MINALKKTIESIRNGGWSAPQPVFGVCEVSWSRVCETIDQLLIAVSRLPEDGYLCVMVDINKKGRCGVAAYAEAVPEMSSEDIAWLLEIKTDKTDREPPSVTDRLAPGRSLYTLTPTLPPEHVDSAGDDYLRSELSYVSQVSCYFSMLDDSDPKILMFIGKSPDGKEAQAQVLFSFAEKLTCRQLIAAQMALPGMQMTELTDAAAEQPLPRAQFIGCMDVVLRKISDCAAYANEEEKKNAEPTEEEYTDDDPCDEDDPMSKGIETLQLSSRAERALRLASILTVGQLCAKNESELMKVRLLGRRCLNEIIERLASMSLSLREEDKTEQSDAPEETPDAAQDGKTSDARAELEQMIGLASVKQQVKKIEAFAKMRQAMKDSGADASEVVLNMEFVGNPGTAKTTVARILAARFYELGLLKKRDIVEVSRADLVAKYVGHTADQVRKVFERADGRLLFIDEAYSLADSDSFADEAIDAIVKEMEDRRDRTVVIFAGYPKEMERFFRQNPGLRSRVPFRICFEDLTPEEMADIAFLLAKEKGFTVDPDARPRILEICRSVVASRENGNGRFSRNLVENAILSFAERVYGGDETVEAPEFILRAEDFIAPDTVETPVPPMLPIGFRAA